MRFGTRCFTTFGTAAAIAAVVACGAPRPRSAGDLPPSRTDRRELTRAQMLAGNYLTVYDAVVALRTNWLRSRGPDSFSSPSQVLVYLDGNRLGDVERLREFQPNLVASVRYLDGIAAQARWGVGHSAGVIEVRTWTAAPAGTPRGDSIAPQRADTSAARRARKEPDSTARTPQSDDGDVTLAAPSLPLLRTADASYLTTTPGAGRFPLAVAGRPVPIVVSATDWPGVVRATRDLRADLGKVTGSEPALDSLPRAPRVVIVGTIGRSPLVDALVRAGKVDTSGVAGRWEAFLLQTVREPVPGVAEALVIAGSDKRGTIYGVYDLAERAGVSPWYWWADAPVPRRPSLHVLPGRHASMGPAVKYRGIFINDEAPAFSGWTREKFGGFNHQVYARVFELILRMKGNYLWPAMWGNAFADDDSLNARLADEYGVVIGTSHHEPMTRAHAEWQRYHRGVPWDYSKSDSTLRAFWREGIRRNGAREHLVTLGMRGDGDEPMTQGTATALLERIVADQRKIIAEETRKPAEATPQVWALYKEVQDYYDQGMRVPEDVTLLFADDNWGNIRRLPKAAERGRAGGFGVYYHFDYVGGPRNYKWVNTNQIARVREQMHMARELGADRIWIVNVGDIKPMELPIQFFLDHAWNPEAIPPEGLRDWTRRWARQQLPALDSVGATEAADVVTEYQRLASRRKPELLDTTTYSLVNWREAERVLEEWQQLAARANRVAASLPASHRDAWYQLALHPILAVGNFHDLQVTAARNRLYALQGRAATNVLAERARRLFARDAEIGRYYNDTLAGGKWSHMMDQTHVGYTYWQEPPRNVMPRVDEIHLPRPAEMGVWIVQQNRPAAPRRLGQGGPPPGAFGPRELALPAFDPFLRQTWHVDVYNRGSTPFAFTAQAAEPWVLVTPSRGTIATESRLAVTIDWARAPQGVTKVPITVTGANGAKVTVQAPVENRSIPRDFAGFVQGNGVVSIEAPHVSRWKRASEARWRELSELGRTRGAITSVGDGRLPGDPNGGASVEYDLFAFDTGAVRVHVYVSPTHDVLATGGLRYAIALDDEKPQVVNLHADGSSSGTTDGNRAWERSVADNVKVLATEHRIARTGAHVLRLTAIDPHVVVQKVVVAFGELPQTYLGPPESHHTRLTAGCAAGRVACLRASTSEDGR